MKVLNVFETSTGVLLFKDSTYNDLSFYQPDCSLVNVQDLLYEFYYLKTSSGLAVKDSFILAGTDYFSTVVSQLYWQYFRYYIMYKPLVVDLCERNSN